jgi:tetratricopeptide (TPR) repeat protein
MRKLWIALAALALVLTAGPVPADMSPAVPAAPPPATGGPPSAERSYNDGLDFAKRGAWARAAGAFERAVQLRDAFPEAWNGLGYALRQQARYPEAVKAYERALALRPNYVEALEYLGEAYVRMGKLDEARKILARLQPLDREEAGKLRAAIEGKQ